MLEYLLDSFDIAREDFVDAHLDAKGFNIRYYTSGGVLSNYKGAW